MTLTTISDADASAHTIPIAKIQARAGGANCTGARWDMLGSPLFILGWYTGPARSGRKGASSPKRSLGRGSRYGNYGLEREVILATSALDREWLAANEPTSQPQSGGRARLLVDRSHLHVEPAG